MLKELQYLDLCLAAASTCYLIAPALAPTVFCHMKDVTTLRGQRAVVLLDFCAHRITLAYR